MAPKPGRKSNGKLGGEQKQKNKITDLQGIIINIIYVISIKLFVIIFSFIYNNNNYIFYQ